MFIFRCLILKNLGVKVLKNKKPREYALSKKYFNFLKARTNEKTFEERKKLKFHL